MTSWRATASPQIQNDLDELLRASLGFAQQQLSERGGFYPYAVAITSSGETEMIGARPDIEHDRPASTDVLLSCQASLRDRRDQLRATAVIADVAVAGVNGDAIQVSLEHSEGPALTVLLPYTRGTAAGRVEFGELRASAGNHEIW